MTGVRDPRRRLRKIARIARWEVSHSVGTADRRTVVLVTAALLLGLGAAGAAAVGGSVALEQDLYQVSVAEESPYYDPVADAPDRKSVV